MAPRRRPKDRRFLSIDTVPARATTAQTAKKTSEAASPLPIRCTSAQSPTPVRNGCRVTRAMPCGGCFAPTCEVTALKRGIQDVDCSAFRFDPDQSPLGSRGDILRRDITYIYGHKESDRGSGRSSGWEDLTIE
jgi:hypothetical protein